MKNNPNSSSKTGLDIKKLLMLILIWLVVMAVTIIVSSYVIFVTYPPEWVYDVVSLAIIALSSFLLSFMISLKIKKKVFAIGSICGIISFGSFLLLGLFLDISHMPLTDNLMNGLLSVLFGLFGSVCGASFKRQKRRVKFNTVK